MTTEIDKMLMKTMSLLSDLYDNEEYELYLLSEQIFNKLADKKRSEQ